MHLVRNTEVTEVPFEDLTGDFDFQGRGRREGTEFKVHALEYLERAGCEVLEGRHHVTHYPVDGLVRVASGERLLVAAHGVFDEGPQAGLRRTDTVHKLGHRAHVLNRRHAARMIVVTSHLPFPGSAAARYIADLHLDLGNWLVDVIATSADFAGLVRFTAFASSPGRNEPSPAPWWNVDPQRHDQSALSFEETTHA